MRRIQKTGAAFLVLLALAALLSATAFAKTEEYTVTVREDAQNYLFDIQWENTQLTPQVTLTAPDGQSYSLDNMPQAAAGEGELLFWFADPAPGDWTVSVSGEGLGWVTVDAGVQPGRMDITAFTVSVSGEEATVSWAIADSEEQLRLEVWATTDPQALGGVRAASFTGRAAGDSHTFSLSGLDSGDYYFYLKAIGTGGIFATAYAGGDALHWKNANALPPLSSVQARMLDEELWVSWQPAEEASGYRVLVRNAATGETLFDEECGQEYSWYGALPESVETVQVFAAARRGGITGDYTWQTVSRSAFDGVSVSFPQAEQLNTRAVIADVAFTGAYTVSAALNGEMVCEGQKQPGSYRIDLEEGDNRVTFYLTDAAGNIRSFGRDFHVDTTPPVLRLHSDLDGLTTNARTVWLSGMTETGAQLTLNGEPVETQQGYFDLACTLRPGENTLLLIAEDGAGNRSQYTAVVTRPWLSAALLGWIACGAAFVGLGVWYTLVLVRGRRRQKNEKPKNS